MDVVRVEGFETYEQAFGFALGVGPGKLTGLSCVRKALVAYYSGNYIPPHEYVFINNIPTPNTKGIKPPISENLIDWPEDRVHRTRPTNRKPNKTFSERYRLRSARVSHLNAPIVEPGRREAPIEVFDDDELAAAMAASLAEFQLNEGTHRRSDSRAPSYVPSTLIPSPSLYHRRVPSFDHALPLYSAHDHNRSLNDYEEHALELEEESREARGLATPIASQINHRRHAFQGNRFVASTSRRPPPPPATYNGPPILSRMAEAYLIIHHQITDAQMDVIRRKLTEIENPRDGKMDIKNLFNDLGLPIEQAYYATGLIFDDMTFAMFHCHRGQE